MMSEDFDRLIKLSNDFGRGYDSSGGLEYETIKGLDEVLVKEIRKWKWSVYDKRVKPNLEALTSIRADMKTSATSAAHELDDLILLSLQWEVDNAKAINEVPYLLGGLNGFD